MECSLSLQVASDKRTVSHCDMQWGTEEGWGTGIRGDDTNKGKADRPCECLTLFSVCLFLKTSSSPHFSSSTQPAHTNIQTTCGGELKSYRPYASHKVLWPPETHQPFQIWQPNKHTHFIQQLTRCTKVRKQAHFLNAHLNTSLSHYVLHAQHQQQIAFENKMFASGCHHTNLCEILYLALSVVTGLECIQNGCVWRFGTSTNTSALDEPVYLKFIKPLRFYLDCGALMS